MNVKTISVELFEDEYNLLIALATPDKNGKFPLVRVDKKDELALTQLVNKGLAYRRDDIQFDSICWVSLAGAFLASHIKILQSSTP